MKLNNSNEIIGKIYSNTNSKQKLKKCNIKKFIKAENEFITKLLVGCNVPNRIEKDDSDLYLLPLKKNIKLPTIQDFKDVDKKKEDLNDRLLKIKNKFKAPKKNNKSEKALRRKEMKKLKKNKEIKKILINSNKAEKNEKIKSEKYSANQGNEDEKDIKPMAKNLFNENGKILFSKIDFAAHPGAKILKSKKDKVMKNPRDILKKMKETDKKINELKEHGDEEKARELKKELIWKKAFDKVQGKKVKDDRNLLYKSIKKRKDLKKKSKKSWKERQEKVEQDISSRQKKREENINKRMRDKKIKKMKRLSKRGRVIPGF
ncbi:surfeit locus protein 6 homolog [Condylostylus longicornis]|uniref:surfeit locus protein 6 homolog n=1 Tax=Condylostylus longicornis TaxID=2530218 RepID=UPI00244E144C|nr:surfeit locus protein 6 homolog [Condylostylus longicornis]